MVLKKRINARKNIKTTVTYFVNEFNIPHIKKNNLSGDAFL